MHILGFFAAFSKVYFTLYSPRSGPCTFWAFSWHFLKSISLYIVLGAGRAHFGIFGPVSILLYVVGLVTSLESRNPNPHRNLVSRAENDNHFYA